MRPHRLVLTLALVLAATTGWAQDFAGPRPEERLFRIQFETVRSGSGNPVVRGLVDNRGNEWVRRVVLLVEGLDAGGGVVGRAHVRVGDEIGPGGSHWFEAPAPALGVTFRVRVHSFDLVRPGGA